MLKSDIKIIEKPWGKEELLEKNDFYVVKRLYMKCGHKCSMQYHVDKIETIYVLSGALKIYIGESLENIKEENYHEGDFVTIKNNMIHRMEGVTDCVYLESSTTQLDDVVRISDVYSRI